MPFNAHLPSFKTSLTASILTGFMMVACTPPSTTDKTPTVVKPVIPLNPHIETGAKTTRVLKEKRHLKSLKLKDLVSFSLKGFFAVDPYYEIPVEGKKPELKASYLFTMSDGNTYGANGENIGVVEFADSGVGFSISTPDGSQFGGIGFNIQTLLGLDREVTLQKPLKTNVFNFYHPELNNYSCSNFSSISNFIKNSGYGSVRWPIVQGDVTISLEVFIEIDLIDGYSETYDLVFDIQNIKSAHPVRPGVLPSTCYEDTSQANIGGGFLNFRYENIQVKDKYVEPTPTPTPTPTPEPTATPTYGGGGNNGGSGGSGGGGEGPGDDSGGSPPPPPNPTDPPPQPTSTPPQPTATPPEPTSTPPQPTPTPTPDPKTICLEKNKDDELPQWRYKEPEKEGEDGDCYLTPTDLVIEHAKAEDQKERPECKNKSDEAACKAGPVMFSPKDRNGFYDQVKFTVVTDRAQDVHWQVKSTSPTPFFKKEGEAKKTGGTDYLWDGFVNGVCIEDGIHTFVLLDKYGNEVGVKDQTIQREVEADNTPPQVIANSTINTVKISSDPDVFKSDVLLNVKDFLAGTSLETLEELIQIEGEGQVFPDKKDINDTVQLTFSFPGELGNRYINVQFQDRLKNLASIDVNQ